MAVNRLFEGIPDTLTLPVASGVESGDPVEVGDLVGVALTDRDADGNATVQLDGVFNLSVTGAVSNVGDPVYIASGALNVTDTNPLFGHALETKGAAAGVIPVRVLHQ